MAIKQVHDGKMWTEWDRSIALREPEAVRDWSAALKNEIQAQNYYQYQFFRQWGALRQYTRQRGVSIMGDLPIYVAHDSADVWAHPEMFHLDGTGSPALVAGVPPDYFSATGQLWGNPLYRWDKMVQSGYRWWIERFRTVLFLVDRVRLDHFRGFEAYWEIPASVADSVIIPLQDLLGLGSEARLNRPSTAIGNWRWRFTPEMLTLDLQERLKRMTVMYGR